MLHAVIMAGGAGTRFWPASRVANPKQLLKLTGDRSMIQSTYDRLEGLVSADQVMVVTNQILVEPISEQLPELPRGAVVGEPCKRDTAACIGLAAALVMHKDPDATMVVLPADHVIEPAANFRESLQSAMDIVDKHPGRIVTFGIRPDYPAETYGYIERGKPLSLSEEGGGPNAFEVVRFREKPDAETAREYLESGNFYWNAGIFVWKAKTILAALQEHAPGIAAHISTIAAAIGTSEYDQVLQREFAAIVGKSIDFAVMEHYQDVAVIEAPYRWDDVGNWQAIGRLRGQDDNGNTCIGRHLTVDTGNSIISSSPDHLIVTVGLEDCIVVHTPDATLVAHRDSEEALRKVVPLIKGQNWDEYL